MRQPDLEPSAFVMELGSRVAIGLLLENDDDPFNRYGAIVWRVLHGKLRARRLVLSVARIDGELVNTLRRLPDA